MAANQNRQGEFGRGAELHAVDRQLLPLVTKEVATEQAAKNIDLLVQALTAFFPGNLSAFKVFWPGADANAEVQPVTAQ